jgi:hypothetical protein
MGSASSEACAAGSTRTRVAEAVREHLILANWKIEKGPALGGHSQLAGGEDSREVNGRERYDERIARGQPWFHPPG